MEHIFVQMVLSWNWLVGSWPASDSAHSRYTCVPAPCQNQTRTPIGNSDEQLGTLARWWYYRHRHWWTWQCLNIETKNLCPQKLIIFSSEYCFFWILVFADWVCTWYGREINLAFVDHYHKVILLRIARVIFWGLIIGGLHTDKRSFLGSIFWMIPFLGRCEDVSEIVSKSKHAPFEKEKPTTLEFFRRFSIFLYAAIFETIFAKHQRSKSSWESWGPPPTEPPSRNKALLRGLVSIIVP